MLFWEASAIHDYSRPRMSPISPTESSPANSPEGSTSLQVRIGKEIFIIPERLLGDYDFGAPSKEAARHRKEVHTREIARIAERLRNLHPTY